MKVRGQGFWGGTTRGCMCNPAWVRPRSPGAQADLPSTWVFGDSHIIVMTTDESHLVDYLGSNMILKGLQPSDYSNSTDGLSQNCLWAGEVLGWWGHLPPHPAQWPELDFQDSHSGKRELTHTSELSVSGTCTWGNEVEASLVYTASSRLARDTQ